MDKLSEHAIRMLEIADKPYSNEYGMINKDWKDKSDIAQAVYDLILQVQMLKMADRKDEPSDSENPNNCEDESQTEERQELEAYRKCIKSRSFWDAKHCDDCHFYDDCPFDEREEDALQTYCDTCKHDLWNNPEVCGKCVGSTTIGRKPRMYEPKTEPQTMYYPQVDGITPSVIVTQMRDATAEERQGVRNYIKSIEKDTGVKFYEDKSQTDCARKGENHERNDSKTEL